MERNSPYNHLALKSFRSPQMRPRISNFTLMGIYYTSYIAHWQSVYSNNREYIDNPPIKRGKEFHITQSRMLFVVLKDNIIKYIIDAQCLPSTFIN